MPTLLLGGFHLFQLELSTCTDSENTGINAQVLYNYRLKKELLHMSFLSRTLRVSPVL